MSDEPPRTARPAKNSLIEDRQRESIRKSWHALNPFSKGALSSLPKLTRPAKSVRHDNIPDDDGPEEDQGGDENGVRNYQAITSVRKPKKVATPIRVEGKVWFANERTWVAWLNLAILMGALSIALFNASKDNIARNFAYFYALVSVGIIIYAYLLYQKRISMIRKRYPGSFDAMTGPVVVSILLFFGVLSNFVIRAKQLRDKNIPLPGESLVLAIVDFLRLDAAIYLQPLFSKTS